MIQNLYFTKPHILDNVQNTEEEIDIDSETLNK